MQYDLDAKIEEAAVEVAADQGLSLEELQDLHLYASNRSSARVFARAVELRQGMDRTDPTCNPVRSIPEPAKPRLTMANLSVPMSTS